MKWDSVHDLFIAPGKGLDNPVLESQSSFSLYMCVKRIVQDLFAPSLVYIFIEIG